MTTSPRDTARAGLVLWLLLLLPAVQQVVQASMTSQMLLQLPLLTLAGWWADGKVPAAVAAGVGRWNAGGVAGLLLSTFAGAVWMLPRLMDASLTDPTVAFAKAVTVPLLVGMPLAMSWPRMGFVVRGVFLLELVATAFRLGWLYLISPDRLCTNYLLADQQRLGTALLALGAGGSAVLTWRLIWGRVRVEDATP